MNLRCISAGFENLNYSMTVFGAILRSGHKAPIGSRPLPSNLPRPSLEEPSFFAQGDRRPPVVTRDDRASSALAVGQLARFHADGIRFWREGQAGQVA